MGRREWERCLRWSFLLGKRDTQRAVVTKPRRYSRASATGKDQVHKAGTLHNLHDERTELQTRMYVSDRLTGKMGKWMLAPSKRSLVESRCS